VARDKRYGWRLVAATSALALIAGACGDAGDETTTDDPDTTVDGEDGEDGGNGEDEEAAPPGDAYCEEGGDARLRWTHEQEPPDLHLNDPANNLTVTSWVRRAFLESPYGVSAETTFIPQLIESEEFVEEDGAWRYNFTLRDDLMWSDGTPLTAEHVKGTFDIVMEGYDYETGEGGEYLIGSREVAGWSLIDPDSWEVDGQTYSFTTEEFFSGVQGLFDPVYPSHVLTDAATANEALQEWTLDGEPLPSSGPMVFTNWDRGVNLTMERNDDYHGANPENPDVVNEGIACVSGVDIAWVADTDAQINSLLAAEADVIMTQPQVAFGERIATDDNFTVSPEAGPIWEHWGFNLNNVHLSDVAVREGMAYAMNKPEVMTALYTPLFEDLLPEEGLGNVYWMSNQPDYVDHQTEAGYGQGDAEAAAERFESAGYEQNAEGIWEHPERGPLSLRVGTTGGNQLRELQIQIMQESYREAGVDIQIDNVPGGAYFAERPFAPESTECSLSGGESGDCELWDLTQFAWVGGPWPGAGHNAFLSDSGNNAYGYQNEEFDALAAECDSTADDAERADCYNTLSSYVTTLNEDPEGLVVMPITQKPSFYAYSNETLLRGAVAPDANSAGPLVNVVDFLPAP
jgi:peptide/nickel transport system substrate-binding protein